MNIIFLKMEKLTAKMASLNVCAPTHTFMYKDYNIIKLCNDDYEYYDLEDILKPEYYYHGSDHIIDIFTNGFIKNVNKSKYSEKHLKKWNNNKMFGDGIYFADYISKAAKFSKNILVCEIDFTNKNILECKYDTNPHKNIDCIIGLGKYNRFGFLEDKKRPLNYYEYCVYNVNMIKPVYYLKIE